jgi:outer membrane protein TolC
VAIGIVLLFLLRPAVSLAEGLGFDAALEQVFDGNARLQAARAEVARRDEEQAAARGLRYPRATVNGRLTRIDAPMAIDLAPIRQAMLALHPTVPAAAVPAFVQPIQDEQFARLSADLTWPVFTGGRVHAAIEAAGAQRTEAQLLQRQVEGSLLTELAQRYFGLRLAQAVLQVRQQALSAMDEHLRAARSLEAHGTVPRVERLHAEVAQAEAQRDLARASRDLDLARTALAATLGSNSAPDPSSPLFVVADLEPLADFQTRALAANPQLGQLAAQRLLAQTARRAERAALLPTVYLFGSRQLVTRDLTLLDPEWAAGVGFTLEVLDGGARRHRRRASRCLEERVVALQSQAQRDLTALVAQRYTEVEAAREAYASAGVLLTATTEYERVRTRAFEEGMATSVEVVDARLAAARARVARLVAARDLDVNLAQLLEAAGGADRFAAYRTGPNTEVVE